MKVSLFDFLLKMTAFAVSLCLFQLFTAFNFLNPTGFWLPASVVTVFWIILYLVLKKFFKGKKKRSESIVLIMVMIAGFIAITVWGHKSSEARIKDSNAVEIQIK